MTKEKLEIKKWEENSFRLSLNEAYFGMITAISNENETEYAVIYKRRIPAISGPPGERKTYLGNIKELSELEKFAIKYSKKIAKEEAYLFCE